MKSSYLFAAALALLTACSDDLAGTYSQYAGDGPIRYTGKVTNVTVDAGWECLRAHWTPSKDPAVKNIRVTWISENADTTSAEVAPDATDYTIQGLANQNYQVMVQSIAQDGAPSLADKITKRPYTYEHEAVKAFTQGFNKYYLYKDHLLLFMGNWNDGIKDFSINYTDKAGKAASKMLTEDVFYEKFVDIPDVDFSKDVTLLRTGMIEGCPDVITFEPVKLTKTFLMNTDLKKELRQHYGLGNDDVETFAANAQTVGLDYNLYSLQDLLYFTNLKELNLGAGRYMLENYAEASSVTALDPSVWTIEKLHEIGGVKVNMYADAYIGTSAPSFVFKNGVPTLPEHSYYTTTGWSVTTSQSDSGNSLLNKLLDDNAATDWKSWPAEGILRSFDLLIDMKTQQTIHGISVTQSADDEMHNYATANITVEYATTNDPSAWHYLNNIDSYLLGTAQGETSIINAASAVNARYLRLTVKERTYNGVTRVALADIKVF